jgi:aminomethyltransferase
LIDGRAQYSCLPNETGGIVDDLIVYRIHENEYLLVVNASNIEKDWNWIQSQNTVGAILENRSDDYSLLAIQGPKAIEAMQSLTSINLSEIKYYHFEIGNFAGFNDIIVSATGYTGSGGFEIYCKNDQVDSIWKDVFTAGAHFGIKPIGLAARDTLRLEMGYCLYGNDINDHTSPLEAGLGWITKFTKEFTNSAALQAQKNAGVQRKLVGFELLERGIPRHDYLIVNENGDEIGMVTSGTMAPSLNKGIGLGYVKTEYSTLDSQIFIQIRNKNILAKVVKLPFYQK